jgi:CAAX protease family protein
MTPQPEPPPPAEGALAASPPAASAAAPPAGPPRKPMADLPEGEGPQWAAWQALLGFFAAYLGTATAVLIVSLAALPAGVNLDDPPPVFNIVGVLVQDVVFIVAAIAFAAISARPRRWHFGLRRTRFGRTLGWAAIGLVAYIAFTIAYQALVDPQGRQSIADALGVKRGAALLVIGGFVVIVMAPIAEEFFFRGFFYRAMRNSLGRVAGRRAGILLGAVLTGAIFGVMHLEPDRMGETLPLIPLLVVLGVVFCLVYERTKSLFAVIGLHAIVNMFGYLLIANNSWVVALGFGGAMVIGCMVLPRFLPRPPTATAAA